MIAQPSPASWRLASRLTGTFQGHAAHRSRASCPAEPQRLTGALIEPVGISPIPSMRFMAHKSFHITSSKAMQKKIDLSSPRCVFRGNFPHHNPNLDLILQVFRPHGQEPAAFPTSVKEVVAIYVG
jgi:hypothetical protein